MAGDKETPLSPSGRGVGGEGAGTRQLARRISVWTTNCLLSLLILAVGLGFGRQVLRWWRADTPSPSVAPSAGGPGWLGDPQKAHLLEFGDQPWSLQRQTLRGDKQAAAAALRAACRAVLTRGVPPSAPGLPDAPFPSELSQRAPIEQERGKWQIYELSDAYPLVVGVQVGVPPSGGESTLKRKLPPETKLAEGGGRAVVWSIGIPAGPDAWNLYTFQPADYSPRTAVAEIPFPPESGRILSVRVADGGRIAAFAGPRRPDTWKQFYDQWFAQQGWKAVGAWQESGLTWHARFTAPAGVPPVVVDIRFGPDEHGGLRGVVVVTPGT